MKKMVMGLAAVALAAVVTACPGGAFKGLKYGEIIPGDWLQVTVLDVKSAERVLWFQVFDQKGDDSIVSYYKKTSEKVAGYPANVNADRWIWILVNDRIEIRLLADETRKDFQNTARLEAFMRQFDLAGLAAISGDRMTGKAFRKYIPKL